MKWTKRLLVIFIFIIAYWNIGTLHNYWISRACYYPNSITAKILLPAAPFKGLPFSDLTPEVYQAYKDKFGSFENYYSKEGKSIAEIVLWPVVFAVVSIAVPVTSWIIWLIIQFWHAVSWTSAFLFSGEVLKTLHLIP